MRTTVEVKPPSAQRLRKERMMAAFAQDCESAEGLFVAEYAGIDVATLSQLRLAARAAGGRVRVMNNEIAKRVIEKLPNLAAVGDALNGQLIYGTGTSAPAMAKVFKEFAKEHEQLVVRAGAIEGAGLDPDEIERLASLPGRDELIGILAGTLQAPIAKLARTLAEVPSAMARAVAAVRDEKAKSETTAS